MSKKWFEYDSESKEILGFSKNVKLDYKINIRNIWNSVVKKDILLEIKDFHETNNRRPILSDLAKKTHMSKGNLSINLKELRLRRIILFHEKTTNRGKIKEIELLIEPIARKRTKAEKIKDRLSKDAQQFKRDFAGLKRDLGIRTLQAKDVINFLKDKDMVNIEDIRKELGFEADKVLRRLNDDKLVKKRIIITKIGRMRERDVFYSLA
jgi:hypothetical protein